ncbi:MAG: hypothetical protein HFJ01_10865, partial [Lachnospiraceae bacterium]|nr:hypothetical protein [Lachnospiraceae bacterium]
MEKLIDFEYYPVKKALKILLQDKSTKKNIIWATDPPDLGGMEYSDRSQITINQILSLPDVIQPRISKISEEQQERTKKKGEVFTPAWVCNLINKSLMTYPVTFSKGLFNHIHRKFTFQSKKIEPGTWFLDSWLISAIYIFWSVFNFLTSSTERPTNSAIFSSVIVPSSSIFFAT